MHPANLKQATPSGINISVQHNTAPTMAQIIAAGRQKINLTASLIAPPATRKQRPITIKIITSVKIKNKVIIAFPP